MEADVPVRSVKKALDLLDQVVLADMAGETTSLADLAGRMNMPQNSVRNLLKTLAACGYVAQPSRGIYMPGVKVRELGRMNRLTSPAAQDALVACMRPFAAEQGEDCVLAVLAGGERVVVAYVDADQAVRVSRDSVQERPFYELPTGRMLAALADDEELAQIIARHGLPGDRWNGIADEATLRRELAALRRKGWCQVGTSRDALRSWACPVRDAEGAAWGVVGTFVPAFRCSAARGRRLLAALKQLAADLSAATPTAAGGG